MGNLILNEGFWGEEVEKNEGMTPNKGWIPSLIAEFIEELVRNDEKSIPVQYLPNILELIEKLLEKLPVESWDEDSDDPMTKAINTPRGRAIESLVNYALFTARLSDRENKVHESAWKKIEHLFDQEIARCKGNNFEFSTLMGAYYLNMNYLSPDWLKKNILKIFPFEHEENFICAISGLAYSQANKQIYILLRDNKIIEKALLLDIDKRSAKEQLIERICLAYLWGDETLDSPQFEIIFKSESDLIHATNFFWQVYDDSLSEDQINSVLAFWKKCVTLIKKEVISSESLLSTLILLGRYLKEIDEKQKQWLLLLAPYAEHEYNAYRLVDDLERLVSNSPEAVQEILLKLLESYSPYSDFEGKIMHIVKALQENGVTPGLLDIVDKLRYLKGFPELYEEIAS